MIQNIVTNSYEETQKFGYDFVRKLERHNVLALYGDLGSGKTTFVQGFAKGLGTHKKIISPTFIIMRTYEINFKFQISNFKFFYHVDLYRIKEEYELKDLGILDLIKDDQNLFAIEWPEKIEKFLPKKRINLYFEYIDENKRKITII